MSMPVMPGAESYGRHTAPSDDTESRRQQRHESLYQSHAQRVGMPGLAAAAGYCSNLGSDYSSSSHQMQSSLGAYASGGLTYDVMDHLAATKALFYSGYQPSPALTSSIGRHVPSGNRGISSGVSYHSQHHVVGASVHSQDGHGSAGYRQLNSHSTSRFMSSSKTSEVRGNCSLSKPPPADGLLLLLECADKSSVGGSATFPSE